MFALFQEIYMCASAGRGKGFVNRLSTVALNEIAGDDAKQWEIWLAFLASPKVYPALPIIAVIFFMVLLRLEAQSRETTTPSMSGFRLTLKRKYGDRENAFLLSCNLWLVNEGAIPTKLLGVIPHVYDTLSRPDEREVMLEQQYFFVSTKGQQSLRRDNDIEVLPGKTLCEVDLEGSVSDAYFASLTGAGRDLVLELEVDILRQRAMTLKAKLPTPDTSKSPPR